MPPTSWLLLVVGIGVAVSTLISFILWGILGERVVKLEQRVEELESKDG